MTDGWITPEEAAAEIHRRYPKQLRNRVAKDLPYFNINDAADWYLARVMADVICPANPPTQQEGERG